MVIQHVPFPQNKNFTGRESVLNNLQNMLFKESKERVALVGLGGIGKTQVALQLAYWVMRKRQPCSVICMPALSMAGFEKTCADVVQELGIACGDKEDPKELMQQYLSSEEAKSWLLIVDNADDMDVLYGKSEDEKGVCDYLPRSDGGCILFTTRLQEVAVNVAGSHVEELKEMDVREAEMLLKRTLIRQDQLQDEKMLKDFLDKLTCLPLAIAQATAYINIEMINLAEYINIFTNAEQDAIELLSTRVRDGAHYHSSQKAAATTWVISFRQIREKNPLAAQLLSFIRWIEPKGIPRGILPHQELRQRAAHAIGTLCGYRFLERRGESDVFDMHSLVHLAIREWSKEEEVEEMTQKATFKHLRTIFGTDDWNERGVWQMYLPHVLRALEVGLGDEGEGEGEEYCEVGYWAGRCLRVDGRMQEAVRLLKHVVTVEEKRLAEDHPDRLASQHELAGAYEANGQVKEAVALLEHVVAVEEKRLAENHPSRLASQHELARAYRANGQVKEAVELLEHVVAVQEKTLAEDHPDRLASQHALAMMYADLQ